MRPILPKAEQRTGATLIEILMALMIMSIGVVSIATLFPLAMKRALQASQLTNMQLLREQVMEMLVYHPELLPINDPTVHNTDPTSFTGPPNPATTISLFPSGVFAGQGLVNARSGSYVIRVVDPLGVYETTSGFNFNGLNGLRDNSRRIGGPIAHPLGSGTPLPANEPVRRTHAGWSLNQARARVPLRDSWVSGEETTFIPASQADRSTLTYPPSLDNLMQDLDTRLDINEDYDGDDDGSLDGDGDQTNDIEVRLMLFDTNSKTTQLRTIRAIDSAPGSRQITLSRPLPDNGLFDAVSEVRVQEFEQRYTWMLTTKTTLLGYGKDNRSGTRDDRIDTEIDLVVFFRRNFSEASETLHRMFFDKSQWTQKGTFRILEQEREKPWIVVEPTQPALVYDPGTFLFHPRVGKWFQIREILIDRIVTNADAANPNFSKVLVVGDVGKRLLQVQLSAFSPNDEEALDDKNVAQVMAPQGVIEVYRLPTISNAGE